MWRYEKENIKKEVGGMEKVNKSGCYKCEIKKAYIWTSDKEDSKTEALILEMITDTKELLKLNIFYLKSDGEEIDFNITHLNHLEYLTKTTHEEVIDSTVWENIYKIPREVIKAFENKKIGVVVEVKEGEKGKIEYNLKTFYEVGKERTAFEISNNKEAEKVRSYKEKYSKTDDIDTDRDIVNSFAKDMAENEDNGFPF